jgi:putative salt-induced outer membrane protein YdiY
MAFVSPATARPAKDIIHFKNGDKWTCEIKKLDRGYLYVGLDYVDGTVNVDWSSVSSIESAQLFVVTDADGSVHIGTLSSSGGDNNQIASIEINNGKSLTTIPRSRVSSIQETESNFWHDLHGGISAGLNFAKSNNQTQYNLNANVDYVKKYWLASSQLQSSFSGSISAPSDLHNDLTTYVMRTLNAKNDVLIGVSDFLKSDEQQIALRTTLGGGPGKILKNTDASRIVIVAGAVWTNEQYETSGTPTLNSADGMAGVILDYFRFKTTNFSTNVFAYPGLSDIGRIRLDAKSSIKYELIKNLYLNFSLYMNYDSRPPHQTSKTDFGASSSLGWSF